MIRFCVHEFNVLLHVLFWPSDNIFTLWQLYSKGRETRSLHVYSLIIIGGASLVP